MQVTISDAMGHEAGGADRDGASQHTKQRRAAPTSSRKPPRQHGDRDNARDEDFVTAIVMRIALATGEVALVNAGHPAAFLVRAGDVQVLRFDADLPFGMDRDTIYREQQLQLQPGDRLVLVTDGMLERNATAVDIVEALQACPSEERGRAIVRARSAHATAQAQDTRAVESIGTARRGEGNDASRRGSE